MKIGIGITTHNRPEVFLRSLEQIERLAPHGAQIVVVDDASDTPLPDGLTTHRFDSNVGIARAKNKCLELLDDCDHIFLFDDDTYPLKEGWWKPYVESPEPHLMYLFRDFSTNPRLNDCIELYRDSRHFALSHPRGCMLYLDRKVLDVVGGMDTRYRRWGNEHVDLSNRVHNAGLTSFRFADVIGSENLIYSGDEHETVITTVKQHERRKYIIETQPLLEASKTSLAYMEYRETVPQKDISDQNNIILSCYFTGHPDPQRGQWEPKFDDITTMLDSAYELGLSVDVLTDSLGNGYYKKIHRTVMVETGLNPYFQRWLSYYQYLRDHPEIDNVFCVDATDVTILRDPFPHLVKGKIYCGDEPSNLANAWMSRHNPEEPIRRFMQTHRTIPLLNAGVLGGSRSDVMRVAHDIITLYHDNGARFHNDMGSFNYILRTKYAQSIEHGRKVTTVFKAYDTENRESWICHK